MFTICPKFRSRVLKCYPRFISEGVPVLLYTTSFVSNHLMQKMRKGYGGSILQTRSSTKGQFMLTRIFFKGSPDRSHFISKINVGKQRIRLRTTLKLNDVIFNRFLVYLEIQFQNRWVSAWVWTTLNHIF